ncbi:hypothetical protein [Synechococcus sp. H65.1]|uniref:hypothetical protein n=1 Tax=unclassified Synechococcus TaxID=2626047 RepID=UPI0039C29301
MERSKWVAMITGVLAIALGVGYLLLVELLDYRGSKFLPAPLEPPAILGSLAGIPGPRALLGACLSGLFPSWG